MHTFAKTPLFDANASAGGKNLGDLPEWDLTDLYASPDAPELKRDLDWLEEAELDRVGCFKYSPVEGAKANDLPDHVPEDIQQERHDRFMEKAQEISTRKLARRVGTRMTVLIDEVDEEGAIGRSIADAPNIDGMVYLNEFFDCQPGDFIEVDIEHSDEYDLWGTPVSS